MPEHEPLNIADKDDASPRVPEGRAARTDRHDDPRPKESHKGDARSADAQVASEPMDLQRLEDSAPPPPGRQRTGDPPAKKA